MNDLTNRIEPIATKKFRIKRSNGKIVKGKVNRAQSENGYRTQVWTLKRFVTTASKRSVNLHVNPVHQFGTGTSLDQTLEAIKDVAFCDAIDGFTMECGDSVTFE